MPCIPGVAELLETLRQRRIGVGIVTRNCAAAVRRMFPQVEQYCQAFLPRDQVTQVKPHPGHLQIALTRLGSAPIRTIMVGDGVLDIQAGKALGMFSVGVLSGETPRTSSGARRRSGVGQRLGSVAIPARTLGDTRMNATPLSPGKLPPALLAALLGEFPRTDPRLVVGPRVGEDAAVIDMGDRLLIAKSDLTFATDAIGYYAVTVNANDIATMGGTPRWFLATLLLPEQGTTEGWCERFLGRSGKRARSCRSRWSGDIRRLP